MAIRQSRGLRASHPPANGYKLAVTRTVSASVARLYDAASGETTRNQWFPRGRFDVASGTRNKSLKGAWNRTSHLEINFYAKGEGKSQLAVQISRLPEASDVEAQRRAWKPALQKLQKLVR